MGFTVNHSEAGSADLIPEGKYEVIIKDAKQRETQNGKIYVSMQLVVRNDCEQKQKNRVIWDTLWKMKEPTAADLSVDGYSYKQIQNLSGSAHLANGKNYENIDEWTADLIGKLLCVTIKHEDYNGMQAKVQWRNETKHPNCTHVWKGNESSPAAEKTGFIEDDNDDIPF